MFKSSFTFKKLVIWSLYFASSFHKESHHHFAVFRKDDVLGTEELEGDL